MKTSAGILIAVFVVLVAIIAGAGTYYTSKSETCGTCHQMRTFYVSWQNSPHADVACMKCHSDPGVWGQIKAKIEGSRRLATYLKWYYGLGKVEAGCCSFTPPVNNKICLQCHRDFRENDKLVALSDHPLVKRFPVHQRHESLDLKCVDCHAGLVHGRLHGSTPVAEDNCRSCHEERGVLNPRGFLSHLLTTQNTRGVR